MLGTHIHQYLLNKLTQQDIFNYLEIGVFDGENIDILSNIFINKTFFGIDPFIEDGNTSGITSLVKGENISFLELSCKEKFKNKQNVKLFNMQSINFYENLSKDQAEEFNVNIVLIDGDHNHPHVKNDINLALKLIGNKNGVFIMDDITLKDVNDSLEYAFKLTKNRLLNINYLESNCFIFEISSVERPLYL